MKCICMYMCTSDFSIQLFVECYIVMKPLWLQYYVYVSPYPVENYPTWFEKIQILASGFQVYKNWT